MRILHLQYIDSLISLMAGCTRRSMLGAIRTAEALRAFYAVSDSIIYSVRIVWNKRAWTQVNGYDQIVRKSSIITSSKSYQPMCLTRWPQKIYAAKSWRYKNIKYQLWFPSGRKIVAAGTNSDSDRRGKSYRTPSSTYNTLSYDTYCLRANFHSCVKHCQRDHFISSSDQIIRSLHNLGSSSASNPETIANHKVRSPLFSQPRFLLCSVLFWRKFPARKHHPGPRSANYHGSNSQAFKDQYVDLVHLDITGRFSIRVDCDQDHGI